MSERQPDDLVTALANELRMAERLGLIQPDSVARHLLSSGLVRPAADVIPKQDVLALADKWEANGTDCGCCRAYTHCTQRLRALVAGGES